MPDWSQKYNLMSSITSTHCVHQQNFSHLVRETFYLSIFFFLYFLGFFLLVVIPFMILYYPNGANLNFQAIIQFILLTYSCMYTKKFSSFFNNFYCSAGTKRNWFFFQQGTEKIVNESNQTLCLYTFVMILLNTKSK